MTNQNNPFYGNYYLNGSVGTGYISTGSIQIPANQPNPFFNQPNRFQSIPGRLVNNLDEITPQEVPMDGSVSLFPQADYSAIYAKTWTKDGTIATVKFIPEQPQMVSIHALFAESDSKFVQKAPVLSLFSIQLYQSHFAKTSHIIFTEP